jgi:homoserine dehydrogenase
VIDRPGVFAEIATALRDNNVSMEKIIQRGRAPGEPVRVVLTTHETKEKSILKTIQAIDQTDAVVEPTRMIRIEPSVFLS